jgi:hypothetical protein
MDETGSAVGLVKLILSSVGELHRTVPAVQLPFLPNPVMIAARGVGQA